MQFSVLVVLSHPVFAQFKRFVDCGAAPDEAYTLFSCSIV